MTRRNTSFEIAEAISLSVDSLNKNQARIDKYYEQLRLSQENNDKNAGCQKKKAYYNAASAIIRNLMMTDSQTPKTQQFYPMKRLRWQ